MLLNAAQALPPAASPGLARGWLEVTCAPSPGGGALLSVQDDGPGVAPADQERIFTPFFTTKTAGTGLGLATVHRIVDAHGGAVTLDSRPGHGARFSVQLPAPGGEQPG